MLDEARKDAQPDRSRMPAAEEAFKPVALPALAAAVRAFRREARRERSQDLPPIPRKEAMFD